MSAPRGPHALLSLDLPPRQDGGIATLVDVLACGLAELGEPVVVYSRGGRDTDAWDRTRPYRIVRMWGHSWVRHPTRNLLPQLPRLLGRERPRSLVVASWALAGRAVVGPARAIGARVALLAYGRDVTAPATLPTPLEHADRVIALTHWLQRRLVERGVEPDAVRVALPGVHPPPPPVDGAALRRRFAPRGGPLVLCVGRLVPRKGHDTLLRAWPAVRRQHPGAVLLLVGQGPGEAALRALRDTLGLGAAARFAGFLDHESLEQAYAAADLFAMPCREEAGGDTEGFGLVFLEAGARGLAVVAGRSGGVAEAVDDGQTGVLVDPLDVEGLGATIGALLGDPARRDALGAAGRRRVEQRFLPRHHARRLLAALEGEGTR